VALGAAACGDDDPCDYKVCDIRRGDCVEAVAEAVACHRGSDVVVPNVLFATVEQVIAATPAPTQQELQDANNYWAGEAHVGLMPSGYDAANSAADSLSNVIAFYSRETKDVVVISDAVSSNRANAYNVLVHEMIHVYQDAEYDLSAEWAEHATTFDRGLAMRAGIEGEATWYQLEAQLELDGASAEEGNWVGFIAEFQDSVLAQAEVTKTPSLDARGLFPYAFGVELAYRAWLDDGPDAISDLVRMPADSVRRVMAGYNAPESVPANQDEQLLPHAVPVLPGHTLLAGGVQSAWLINAMLQRTAGSAQLWSPALERVVADHLTVFRNDETGASVAVWRLADEGGALRATLLAGSTQWVEDGADAPATHLVADVEGDCVLIATGGPDAKPLLDSVTAWESPEQAAERAGLDDSDIRGIPGRITEPQRSRLRLHQP